ncbi:hypothetical protein ACN38_g12440 [Penicillium nordicum]|uniref:Uncharacterized protein n=1 Tax=Penicillium nordicum TaxID=229535 RepID=A0A0M8NYJ3_9EURO|nr:hypothetical protein ACN38_g12440 [Penicillium nordicum]
MDMKVHFYGLTAPSYSMPSWLQYTCTLCNITTRWSFSASLDSGIQAFRHQVIKIRHLASKVLSPLT